MSSWLRFSLSPRAVYSSYVGPGNRAAPGRLLTMARRLVPWAWASHLMITCRSTGHVAAW
ncbi:MAG TPA: hypothetical protein VML55_10650 [Planctomycetaceae bacterium]|nr:hypothetical protein [Planctomycetaceae bacterium]